MILTLVGSGTLVPDRRRSSPALALTEGDLQITVDGGSGTLRRQAELGIDFRRTRILLFTHIHPDHTLDVLHFLFATKYTPGFTRTEPIRIIGPRGFTAFLERLRDPIGAWTDGGAVALEVEEWEDGEARDVGSLRIQAIELQHSVRDLGYRITSHRGAALAITGDTEDCPALRTLARGVDVLVAECSGDDAHRAPGHLAAPDLGRAAEEAGVSQLILTHLYPLPDDRSRIPEVADSFSGPVHLAGDGDRFVI